MTMNYRTILESIVRSEHWWWWTTLDAQSTEQQILCLRGAISLIIQRVVNLQVTLTMRDMGFEVELMPDFDGDSNAVECI